MQLQYRQSSYRLNSEMAETVETGRSATFLGRQYPMRRPLQPMIQPSPVLKYRGISYANQ